MLSSLGRALDVLELLARERRPTALGAIAAQLGVSKSGVHEVLATLVRRGYVERAHGGIYQLGIKAWEVGAAASVTSLVQMAAPVMERLTARVDEGVVLSVLFGFDSVNVHMVEGGQTVRVYARVGERYPAHCASVGLALLAFQADGYLEAVLPPVLLATAPQTITDPAELRRELARIRARGYAVNLGGWRGDVGGVAACVLDGNGIATAGICIAAPRYRTTKTWLRRVVPAVAQAAATLSEMQSNSARSLRDRLAS